MTATLNGDADDDRPFDENDPLWKDPIDDKWFEESFERLAREFARQLFQQENVPMSTGGPTRLANVRTLDQLNRLLERMARQHASNSKRRGSRFNTNPDAAFLALERRIFPLLELAVARRDPQSVER
jgi:hypothetical protein